MVERNSSGSAEFRFRSDSALDSEETALVSDVTVFEARLDTVLNTAVDGIIVTNDRARVLMYNAACEKMFGYPARDVIGRNATILMAPRHARTHDEYVASYMRDGREGVIGRAQEVLGRHQDGTLIPIELTVGEAHTPVGRQFIGILRDLRPREAMHQRMDEMQQQLLRLSRRNAVEEMGAAMAHELNQPLTAMTLYLQAIEKKSRLIKNFNPDVSELLQKALRETERASQIIQSMRRFSKRAAMRSMLTNVGTLIIEAVDLTMVGFRMRGVKVEIDIEDCLPELRIDSVQIEQILVNLLRNAIEAVQDQKKGRIAVRARNEGKFVSISVTDSGLGIEPEAYRKLFQTFSSSKESGMGLGLAISNTIAQSHGGHFDVDPGGNGRGATFTLRLPVPQDMADEKTVTEGMPTGGLHSGGLNSSSLSFSDPDLKKTDIENINTEDKSKEETRREKP